MATDIHNRLTQLQTVLRQAEDILADISYDVCDEYTTAVASNDGTCNLITCEHIYDMDTLTEILEAIEAAQIQIKDYLATLNTLAL